MRLVDDLADRLDRLDAQRRALVTRKVHLHVRGLGVGALRTCRGDQVAPEIVHMLDVLGVGLQLADEIVVVAACLDAERLIALEHDHRHAVGVELLEVRTQLLHRDHRRRFLRRQRHRMLLANYLQLRHNGVRDNHDGQPAEDDRDRQQPDHTSDQRPRCMSAHADFSKQNACASVPVANFCSRTSPLTVIRHPMESLSPCATRFANIDGSAVVIWNDHGRLVKSAR